MSEHPDSYKKSSFGSAFAFLDKRKKEALAFYYSFCRLMDDIADEDIYPDKLAELARWDAEIRSMYAGNAQTELGKELYPYVREFSITPDRFLLMIEGMRADVSAKRYETFEDLSWYLYRVAGVVGLACMDILGVKSRKADVIARDMGYAVQLTNIIRDVWEDAAMGRVYLPEEDLKKFGLTRRDILDGSNKDKVPAVLAFEAARAKKYYASAFHEMKEGSLWRKLLPCRVMGYVYYGNLTKIARQKFIFDEKIKLTKREKIATIVYALFKRIF